MSAGLLISELIGGRWGRTESVGWRAWHRGVEPNACAIRVERRGGPREP